jgi:hypothetical protein
MTAREINKNPDLFPLKCTGCFEQGENGGKIYAGKYHKGFKMMIGVGCEECKWKGYTVESHQAWEDLIKFQQMHERG